MLHIWCRETWGKAKIRELGRGLIMLRIMKTLLLLITAVFSFNTLADFRIDFGDQRDFNEISKIVKVQLKLYNVDYISCDILILEMSDCRKGILKLAKVKEAFPDLVASQIVFSRKNIALTADKQIYINVKTSTSKMAKLLKDSQELDFSRVTSEVSAVTVRIKQKWKTPQANIICQTLMEEGLYYAPVKRPAVNPVSLTTCLAGMNALMTLNVPEGILNGDTIHIADHTYWTNFQQDDFFYSLHFEMGSNEVEWIEKMVEIKTEFYAHTKQMRQNFNLAASVKFDCGFTGRLDWCFDGFEMLQGFKMDLSSAKIDVFQIGLFEMHCWTDSETKERIVQMPNDLSHEKIRENLNKCYFKSEEAHEEEFEYGIHN